MIKLIIQSPNTRRSEWELQYGMTAIGRREDNDIVLDHNSVSRVHAKLIWDQETDQLLLRDLGSTNSTYLNSKRVIGDVEVSHSDQIRVGNFLITVVGEEVAIDEFGVHALAASEDTDSFDEIMIQAVDQYAVLLHDLSTQLVVLSDLYEAIDVINNFIVRMLNADHSAIYFSDYVESFLESLNAPHSVLQCVESKIPVAFNSETNPAGGGVPEGSNIIVPVLVDQNVYALLHIASYGKNAKVYEEGDLQFCVAVSHQAALTLQRLDFEEKLIHSALHDPITGLPNRVSLLNQLEYVISRVKRNPKEGFALFFIDIDNFKLINDSLGHVIGDKVLSAVAHRLTKACREIDLIVRFGGDEFAILHESSADVPELTLVAQRLIEKISEPFMIDNHEIVLTMSLGITVSSLGYDIPEEVIRDADIAMYQAKAIDDIHMKFFDKSMHLELVNLLQIQNKLREAHKRGDFVLEYQPIIDVSRGGIVGLEALLRWNKQGEGLVMPEYFLSSMDTTGLLSSVEGWVIRTACSQLAWLNQNIHFEVPICMSINLSEKLIRQPNLLELVQTTLETNDIPPHLLWLEINEQAEMKNMEAAASVFERFREMGIKVCLDDFGTGYSTLSYLNSFPLDILKIDKSFVNDVDSNANRSKLVKTIIGLGKNLDLEVVAEGVETSEQLAFLRKTDCDYAQGFLMAKSLGADEIVDLLKSHPTW